MEQDWAVAWTKPCDFEETYQLLFGQGTTLVATISLLIRSAQVGEWVGHEPVSSSAPVTEANERFAIIVAGRRGQAGVGLVHEPLFHRTGRQLAKSGKPALVKQTQRDQIPGASRCSANESNVQVSAQGHDGMVGSVTFHGGHVTGPDKFAAPFELYQHSPRGDFVIASRSNFDDLAGAVAVSL